MLKHEREIYRRVTEIAAKYGLEVHFDEFAGTTHRKLVLIAPSGERRIHSVSSSPKIAHHAIDNTCKWAKRAAKELSHG